MGHVISAPSGTPTSPHLGIVSTPLKVQQTAYYIWTPSKYLFLSLLCSPHPYASSFPPPPFLVILPFGLFLTLGAGMTWREEGWKQHGQSE